jgi:hypothetical protein
MFCCLENGNVLISKVEEVAWWNLLLPAVMTVEQVQRLRLAAANAASPIGIC